MLIWTVVVWRWQDPFTALYTLYKQHQLASSYEHRAASYHTRRIEAGTPLTVLRRTIAAEARRYRESSRRGQPIGKIDVPRLGLDHMVLVNGTDHDTLKKGPGRDLRTFMPGENQLVYIAGHRTTYLAPFSRIDRLRPRDRVTLELPYATFTYEITGHQIVKSTDLGALRSHGHEQLTLQACHPRFFATHRYLAYARLVRIVPRGGQPYVLPRSGSRAPLSR
jgi:sortase A